MPVCAADHLRDAEHPSVGIAFECERRDDREGPLEDPAIAAALLLQPHQPREPGEERGAPEELPAGAARGDGRGGRALHARGTARHGDKADVARGGLARLLEHRRAPAAVERLVGRRARARAPHALHGADAAQRGAHQPREPLGGAVHRAASAWPRRSARPARHAPAGAHVGRDRRARQTHGHDTHAGAHLESSPGAPLCAPRTQIARAIARLHASQQGLH